MCLTTVWSARVLAYMIFFFLNNGVYKKLEMKSFLQITNLYII